MTNFGNGNGFPESAISLLWNFLIIEGLGYKRLGHLQRSLKFHEFWRVLAGTRQVLGRAICGFWRIRFFEPVDSGRFEHSFGILVKFWCGYMGLRYMIVT